MNAISMDFLRRKLSPQADPKVVEELRRALASTNLHGYERMYRSGRFIVLRPQDAWKILHPEKRGDRWSARMMGRALLALFWERGAANGAVIYVKSLEEYEIFGF